MRISVTLAAAAALLVLSAAPASADFGLSNLDVTFHASDGSPAMQAGSHPFAMTTYFDVNTKEGSKGVQVVEGAPRNLDIITPEGFAGAPIAVPRCQTLDFLTTASNGRSLCADSTSLGVTTIEVGQGSVVSGKETVAIHNLHPSPGVAVKLGFRVAEVPITVDVGISPRPPYRIIGSLSNISQITEDHVDKIKNVLKPDQEVTARVIKIDRADRRIGLSIKAASYSDEQLKEEQKMLDSLKPGEDLVALQHAFDAADDMVKDDKE